MEDCNRDGLVTQAKNLIEKYKIETRWVPLDNMAVHPGNRGGVYPNGTRVEGLMTDLLRIGLDADEASHNGYAVMDFAEEARPANYETFKQFNLRQCATSRELSNCFDGQRDICRYGLLSHNHLFLACKAIQNQCPLMWPKAYADLFTRPGGLNMEEVKKRLPVLHGILTRGLWLTLLKPEIMVDHPEACSLISQAMNKNQALGAATAETTALSCMANTLLSIMPSSGVTDKGTFGVLKEKLRHELDAYVDDEHFIDLYDFIINQGGQNSIHMKNVLRFFQMYVDSRTRRLQLAAYSIINNLPAKTPRVHVAVVMRSYRQNPPKGSIWCPLPEALWRKAKKPEMQDLEALLRYFDVDLEPILTKMSEREKHETRANYYIQAADGYASKKEDEDLRPALLRGIARMFEKIRSSVDGGKLPKPSAADCEWIDVDIVPKDEQQQDGKGKNKGKPCKQQELYGKIITFNESGDAEDEQDQMLQEKKADVEREVCWKEWLAMPFTKMLGKHRQCESAVTQVLEALFDSPKTRRMPVAIKRHGAMFITTVVTSPDKDIPIGGIVFPPCVPVSGTILKETKNPEAVRITVTFQKPAVDATRCLQKTPPGTTQPLEFETRYFYVNPERRVVTADGGGVNLTGKESMGPAWLITRMTTEELRKYNSDLKLGERKAIFNVEWKYQEFRTLVIGKLNEDDVGAPITVTVPILTNTKPLKNGDLLVLQKEPAKAKQPTATTWKVQELKRAKNPRETSSGPPAKKQAT